MAAEIIDLGTPGATAGFASATAGPAVAGNVSSLAAGGDEITDQARKCFRHLIRERHHAS